MDDEELTALALAADPHAPLDPDAVPCDVYLSQFRGGLAQLPPLPQWYMPTAMATGRRWWRPVVLVLVFGFLLVDAFGLCGTYGQLVLA
jgi:hypothetical protein